MVKYIIDGVCFAEFLLRSSINLHSKPCNPNVAIDTLGLVVIVGSAVLSLREVHFVTV